MSCSARSYSSTRRGVSRPAEDVMARWYARLVVLQLAFGVVRSSRYRTLSDAKSSITSRVMRVMMACVVVTLWMSPKSAKHSDKVLSPDFTSHAI